MAPEVQSALIAGFFGVIPVLGGLLLRRRSKAAVVIRRSLNRQEALENYVFQLRRQVLASGRQPHRWPADLRYLNRDDQDQAVDDEQS